MSWILAISDSTHDQSVALLEDTNPVCMIELERLTRIKHGIRARKDIDFAKDDNLDYFASLKLEHKDAKETEEDLSLCVNYCLEKAGIKFEDIDLIIGSTLHFHRPFQDNSVWINHYIGHASNFYSSPFEEAAILVVDGYGDSIKDDTYEVAMFAKGSKEKISVLERVYGSQTSYYDMKNSLGVLYRNASVLCGFNLFGQGKVMGLAAFGNDEFFNDAKQFYKLKENGYYELDNGKMFLFFREIINSTPKEKLDEVKANIASAFQNVLEEIVIHLAKEAVKRSNSKNLCISGGIAINSVMNNRILKETGIDNLFVFPAAGDSGIALGAGLWGAYNLLGKKRDNPQSTSLKSASLGKEYTDDDIEMALKEFNKNEKKVTYTHKSEEEIFEDAANNIAKGKIIGWFRGGSEIGPRALGNRSMLADPRTKEMKDIINKRIKHREAFRPFAPSCLAEYESEFFDTNVPEPFMLRVVDCKQKAIEEIPAIVHYDKTARIQTVDKRYNKDYYKLIKSFYDKTGVPVVLNTSFNDNNEPIVETPKDALNCYYRTDLDVLYLGNWEVIKV